MSQLVYRPDGEIGQPAAHLATVPAALGGLRIGVLDNGKPNAALVMTCVAETLAERVDATVSLVTKKGPQGRSANAAIPCAPDVLARVLGESDIVITGTADCGSCTAYSVYDAIELEKLGKPTIVVTTTQFATIAETMSEHFGLPDTRRLVLPHPIGGTDPVTLTAWADDSVDTALTLLHP